jgi:glycosyltransferase involved in cell wall biosynthesis
MIRLITNIDDEGLCKLYNEAAAFVYPSMFEGFGIPILEAMACGCPIVASNIPSTVEIAGNYPIYFEATQIESLMNALDQVVVDPINTDRIHAREEHLKIFSWDKTASQTLEVYRSLY